MKTPTEVRDTVLSRYYQKTLLREIIEKLDDELRRMEIIDKTVNLRHFPIQRTSGTGEKLRYFKYRIDNKDFGVDVTIGLNRSPYNDKTRNIYVSVNQWTDSKKPECVGWNQLHWYQDIVYDLDTWKQAIWSLYAQAENAPNIAGLDQELVEWKQKIDEYVAVYNKLDEESKAFEAKNNWNPRYLFDIHDPTY